MKRSTDRILTTHVGSLPRPHDLVKLFQASNPGPPPAPAIQSAVREVVNRQVEIGIAVVNDGEYGKPVHGEVDYGAWMNYVAARMAGFELRPLHGELFPGKDREDFRDFYQDTADDWGERRPFEVVCTGPVAYCGQTEIAADIARFKAALRESSAVDGFMSVVSPSSLESLQPNYHYGRQEDYAWALAEALKHEYRAVADAGLVLQIDDPGIWVVWDFAYAKEKTLAEFRKFAEQRIEMLNAAIADIPPEQIRYHVCWGSWHGPHSTDIPLPDIVDLLLKVNVGAYCVEAANVRHGHDWKVWRDVDLGGRALIPGVVSHSTNLLEHPEVVADRIVQYASAVGRENVIAGTDCGLGGRIHPQLAWAKLQSLVEGAKLASKLLWS
ncbi:MAG TPA: cobalamin-independent methionine synthase II family protein [Rhizomicrobium sp.]